LLPWDSAHFGVRVARVEGHRLEDPEAVHRFVDDNAVDCVYFLADFEPETIRAAEDMGFRLVDQRVTLERDLDASLAPSPRTRPATTEDLPALLAIAKDAFIDSRFFSDPHFDRERSCALYAEWTRKSVSGELASFVHVLDVAGTPSGFITGRVEGAKGTIGLVGVSPSARGHGVGSALLDSALASFRERGCSTAVVVTQGRNVEALRFYERKGFVTVAFQLWYHGWPRADRRR
jgi:ribosomal protein S18 acetylase RimI-like enzyme